MLNKRIKVRFKTEEGIKQVDGFFHSGNIEHTFKLAEVKDGPPVLVIYRALSWS